MGNNKYLNILEMNRQRDGMDALKEYFLKKFKKGVSY